MYSIREFAGRMLWRLTGLTGKVQSAGWLQAYVR
jgi:hypothetical protein